MSKIAPVLILCRQQQTTAALANVFSKHNEPVMTAESPVDAWECIRAGGISAIIIDLTSPVLEDITLIPKVRGCTETFDIPFVYLVRLDFRTPKYSSFGENWVIDAWLGLPCPATKVRNVVRQLIARSESERQRDASEEAERMTVSLDDVPPIPEQEEDDHEDEAEVDDTKMASPEPAEKVGVTRIASGILNGRLDAIEVSKVLTVIEPLALTGTLIVNNGTREGKIHFKKGAAIHAELADISGPDALFLLFHMKEGTFSFETSEGDEEIERTIKGNTMSLLLEGLRQMDEAKEAVQRLQDGRAQRRKAASGTHLEAQNLEPPKKNNTVHKKKSVKAKD